MLSSRTSSRNLKGKTSYAINHHRKNSKCREQDYSETESCVSMNINRLLYKGESSTERVVFPIDKEFFAKEYSAHKDKELINENKQNDLVHIIQILDGPSKKKKIKIEELYEIINRRNTSRKHPFRSGSFKTTTLSNENGFYVSSEISDKSFGGLKADNSFISGTHSNFYINLEKRKKSRNQLKSTYRKSNEKIYHSSTVAQSSFQEKAKFSINNIRPYMLNAKSRREIRDYDQYLKKRKFSSCPRKESQLCNGKKSAKINKAAVEVKYMSSGFVRSSELSLPETCHNPVEMTSHSCVMEKYRTEPINNKTKAEEQEVFPSEVDVLRNDVIVDAKESEICDFIEEKYPKVMSGNRKTSKSYSIFEKLKGDERDLPGIYSRFVRKSKKVCHRCLDIASQSLYSNNSISDNSNFSEDLQDHIFGELIEDKPVNDNILDLINKTPFNLDKELEKQMKNDEPFIKNEVLQNTSSYSLKKKDDRSTRKKTKLKSSSNLKPSDQNKMCTLETTQSNRILNKNLSRKISKIDRGFRLNKHNHLTESNKRQEKSLVFLDRDVIRENWNMTPTTAITMMVLAANKIIAEKSEFFEKKI